MEPLQHPSDADETSIDGKPINREIWLDRTLDDIKQLRAEGIPMLGLIWWPLLDQLDWDGAMTHRIGKIHEVGLFNLHRQPDGVLKRTTTPLIQIFKAAMEAGETRIGKLEKLLFATETGEGQVPLSTSESWDELEGTVTTTTTIAKAPEAHTIDHADHAAGVGGEVTLSKGMETPKKKISPRTPAQIEVDESKSTDRYGIVVFSHLRWGFVWQRPQQFLSRFAKKHSVLSLKSRSSIGLSMMNQSFSFIA